MARYAQSRAVIIAAYCVFLLLEKKVDVVDKLRLSDALMMCRLAKLRFVTFQMKSSSLMLPRASEIHGIADSR